MERGEEYVGGIAASDYEMQAPQAGKLISGSSASRGIGDMSKADDAASRIAVADVVTITTKFWCAQQNVAA